MPYLALKDDNDGNHEDITAVTNAHIYVAWHNIVDRNITSHSLDGTIDINTSYVSDFEEPVTDILVACCLLSEIYSLNKKGSVTKTTMSSIGTIAQSFITLVHGGSLDG